MSISVGITQPVSLVTLKRVSSKLISSSFNLKCFSKEVYFNDDFYVTKKLQAGVDLVSQLVGVTLGPKGRYVVLENKYGTPRIVNDGETVLKQVELEDPLENLGVKLVRQAGAKTNDIAGDGCTTSIILARGLIAEGVKVLVTGASPVQIARGIEKTAQALICELKLMSREVKDDEIADVAAVSAGNDYEIGYMIADSLSKVGKMGVVRIEKGRSTENRLETAEGMQYDRGYLSPYFVTDRRNMAVEFENCKILLVDKKITNAKEIRKQLEGANKGKYPLLIIVDNIEQEALAPIIKSKLKGVVKVAAIKAPEFGERRSHCLDDIATLTGGTVVRDAMGLYLESVGKEVLGSAVKVVVTKDSTLIVTDGNSQKAVEKRIAQLEVLIENTEEHSKKKLLKERVARLGAGIAIIKVGALTEVELKDKTLRIEDALNAAKAAIEEGVVVGGACCLLRLSMKVDKIKESLENDEQKIGADIFKKALSYPLKLIAQNAGQNGSVVIRKILSIDDSSFGYNAATDCYEDLMSARILDPAKVVRCCLEHAASVARAFMLSDVAIVDSADLKHARVPSRVPPRPLPDLSSWHTTAPVKRPKIQF